MRGAGGGGIGQGVAALAVCMRGRRRREGGDDEDEDDDDDDEDDDGGRRRDGEYQLDISTYSPDCLVMMMILVIQGSLLCLFAFCVIAYLCTSMANHGSMMIRFDLR